MDAFIKNLFFIAADATYGYANILNYFKNKDDFDTLNECIKKDCGIIWECEYMQWKKNNYKKELFVGKNRVKCYECAQLYFHYVMSELVKGKHLSSIKSFEKIAMSNLNLLTTEINVNITKTKHNHNVEEKIQLNKIFNISVPNSLKTNNPVANYDLYYGRLNYFNNLVAGILYYSLLLFLSADEKNRQRIKLCPDCGKFFVSSKFDSRIKKCSKCSPKSRKSKEYNREYAKRYRQVLKAKQIAAEKRAAIKRYMEKAGRTKEEAEEIWNIDHPA